MALTKVTAGVIAANAVVDSFGSQSITGDKIGLTAINANNIVDSSITSAKIVTVANSKITGTITTAQIADGSVTSAKLASDAVPQIVKPIITSPANNATNISNDQLITASSFLSLYGYTQSNAQWQLSTSSNFAFINVENTISGSNSQFQINAVSGLVASTTYYARVRYGDTATPNNTSQYSDTVNFTTAVGFPVPVDYLVVAGGGGGGRSGGFSGANGGAGAGGFRTSAGPSGGNTPAESALSLNTATAYTVTVGAGGSAQTGSTGSGGDGSNSVFATITSIGGGGGSAASPGYINGRIGGSGSGASGNAPSGVAPGGAGTPGQGSAGGTGDAPFWNGGGGGGAGQVGAVGAQPSGGAGGNGIASPITGTPNTYAGGGGGGSNAGGAGGAGGSGGGGAGSINASSQGTPGSVNSGGGAGASGYNNQDGVTGGSGVVIIKYPNTLTLSNPSGGLTFSHSPAVPGYNVTTFTAGTGSIEFN